MSGGAGRQMACVRAGWRLAVRLFAPQAQVLTPTELRLCYQYLWLNGDKGFRLA